MTTSSNSTYKSLLPPNSSALERALEQVAAKALDLPILIKQLHDPDTCPAALLPWLAWSLSVDEWDKYWSEQHQRQVIKESRQIHREKGTPKSIRRVLAAIGFDDIDIVAGLDAGIYNGAIKYDGSHFFGDDTQYGTFYRIYLKKPVTIEQAQQIHRVLDKTAPNRCALYALHFEQAQAAYNGAIQYNGIYSYGVA
ncbi:phage tail protein I [Gammaproteobacteria bacterium AS21]